MSEFGTETTTSEFGADPMSRTEEEQQGYLARSSAQLREMTREREPAVALVALVAGFGVGLWLGCSLSGSSQRSSWHHRNTAENLGRRMLDQIDQFLPDAITRHLHS